ncbi:class IV adenylate cyclase [Natronosalvus rutilus]|uniref:Class IV adenylate cyclase n=1 Tax=Natronosalvus rutilus TaxID=2953753 RepID=A0A9E7N8J9_9EURY|nr:class IV adenylate cyclase [Natronosalvus rutilus]UTF52323.1 class IV adenylate cyclase [Natronosalvus rutilus]
MYEVELKVEVPATLEAVRACLESLGATHEATVVQADTYYDAPHRSFAESDEALRIRREAVDGSDADADTDTAVALHDVDHEARVTYKGPLLEDDSKTRAEHETAVGDGETMDAALTKLGFEPVATVKKRRDRYSLEGYTVTLDAVEGAGEFVEVEADAETEAEIEEVREGAAAILERLDLDPSAQLRTSYLELVLEG